MEYLVDSAALTATADAIRAKTGDAGGIVFDGEEGFAEAIEAIPSEDTPTLQSKSLSISANGNYTVQPDAGYDGLSAVDLAVSVAGASPDFLVFEKYVTFSTKMTSGAQTLASAAELVAAGVIDSTSNTVYSQWSNFLIMLMADPNSFTHSTKQVLYSHRHSFPFTSKSDTRRYSMVTYHNTSDSTTTSANAITTVGGSAVTGHIDVISTTGLTMTASTTYGLGIGRYRLVVACWDKK